MKDTTSQQIILLPQILPSNPSFITTRVSLRKHISSPLFQLKVLRASHPAARKRISKWANKAGKLCTILSLSPNDKKRLGIHRINYDILYSPTLYLLCLWPRELLLILQDPMQKSSFSWEALQLFISFRSITPPCVLQKDFEYGFKAYTRYLMTCDLITYLHIFLSIWLGEPWGQECIPSCLEHIGLEKQFTNH